MSLFEFLMVLVSIVVGLGFAEILTGVAHQIRYREEIRCYWLHSCGVALVTLALLQSWWELWGLRHLTAWDFYGLAMMLVSPAALYLIAHLAFPERGQACDMRAYYHDQMRPIWWLALLSVAASTLFKPIAFGSDLLNLDNAAPAFLAAGFVVLAVSRNALLHAILVPLFLLLLICDVLIWHPSNTSN